MLGCTAEEKGCGKSAAARACRFAPSPRQSYAGVNKCARNSLEAAVVSKKERGEGPVMPIFALLMRLDELQ
jgi:hypothetical protein